MKDITIESRIQGIPCRVQLSYQEGYRGRRERGSGLQLEPDEPASWDIIAVYDRKGYPAAWLERKITWEDEERIQKDAFETMEEGDKR